MPFCFTVFVLPSCLLLQVSSSLRHVDLQIAQTKPAKGSMIYSKNLLNLNKTRLRTQTNAGLQPKALPRNSTIYVTVRRTPNSQRRQMPSPSSIGLHCRCTTGALQVHYRCTTGALRQPAVGSRSDII